MTGTVVFVMWSLAFRGSIVVPDERISSTIAEEGVQRLFELEDQRVCICLLGMLEATHVKSHQHDCPVLS